MARTLAERLARVADRSTLRLTHHGRKTGKSYVVTIWFAVDGETLYLATMNRNRQWVRNVMKDGRVRLDLGAEHFDGDVSALTTQKQMVHAYDLFARKYWLMWVLDWVATLTLRSPRRARQFAAGRGGFFRVDVAAETKGK